MNRDVQPIMAGYFVTHSPAINDERPFIVRSATSRPLSCWATEHEAELEVERLVREARR